MVTFGVQNDIDLINPPIILCDFKGVNRTFMIIVNQSTGYCNSPPNWYL
jgi:hypothetical protein